MAEQLAGGGGPHCESRTGTRLPHPSMGGSGERLTQRRRTLAQLDDRAEAVAHRVTTLHPSSTLLGTSIREVREAFSRLHRATVGAQDGNPLQ